MKVGFKNEYQKIYEIKVIFLGLCYYVTYVIIKMSFN